MSSGQSRGRGRVADERRDKQQAKQDKWMTSSGQSRTGTGRASDGCGTARRVVGVAMVVGMGWAVGPDWWEGRSLVGMGRTEKGSGMADDGGLHLFLVPEPLPLAKKGMGMVVAQWHIRP